MKYAIWDKKTPIITNAGEFLSAEEWMERNSVAKQPDITCVCGGGTVNGATFYTIGGFVDLYTQFGCDFTGCTTDEEKVARVNEFEEEKIRIALEEAENEKANANITADSLASIAASLEFQNMMALPDVEV